MSVGFESDCGHDEPPRPVAFYAARAAYSLKLASFDEEYYTVLNLSVFEPY